MTEFVDWIMDSLSISTIDTTTPSISTTSTTTEEATTVKEKPGTKPIENNQSNYSIWEDQVDLATLTETINTMTYSEGKKKK